MLIYILFYTSDSDLKTRQIPDKYPLAICLIAIAAGVSGLITLSLARANLALLILILTSLVSGLGDAKLFAALTLLFGPEIFTIIIISFILAGAFSCARLLAHELELKDTIAFAPYISVPALGLWLSFLAQTRK